jgi:hypothetical protein
LPIGGSLVSPEGFCSEHSSSGRDVQPAEILNGIRHLPKREGSDALGDRHRCPYCAYLQGFLDALKTVENDANAALVAHLRRTM